MIKKQLESNFQQKHSLLWRFLHLYFWLTLINVMFFWLAVGTNQIRLIEEKARAEIRQKSMGIVLMLHKQSMEKKNLLRWIKSKPEDIDKIIGEENLLVLSDTGKILHNESFSLSENKIQEIKKNAIKAIWLLDFKQKEFHAVPSLSQLSLKKVFFSPAKNKVGLFVPVHGNKRVYVFYTQLSTDLLNKEFRSLLILAVMMIVIILLLQTLLGYILYRIIVKPILSLSKVATEVEKGDYQTVQTKYKKKDEIGLLIYAFNNMVKTIKARTEKLNEMLDVLKKRDTMIQNELTMAAEVQEGILPKKVSSHLFRAAVYFRPFEKVSGDYYDIFHIAENKDMVLLADVSGHGIPAALITMLMKTEFEALAYEEKLPAEIFAEVNDRLYSTIVTDDYATAMLLQIEPNKILFSNAGMPAPILYENRTGDVRQLQVKGSLLGAFPSKENMYFHLEVPYQTGDRLFLFSDGILETGEPGSKIPKDKFKEMI
ncbi:MAG: HAMP domain-containing protein, partial [Candidatus Hydrogenedentota bacterium]